MKKMNRASMLIGMFLLASCPVDAQFTTTSGNVRLQTAGRVNIGTNSLWPTLLHVDGSNLGSGDVFRTTFPGGTNGSWQMWKGYSTEVGRLFSSGTTSPGTIHFNMDAVNGHLRSHTAGVQRMQLNWTRNILINGFSAATSGFVGLSNQAEFYTGAALGPFSRLHLAQEYAGTDPAVFCAQTAYRPWMTNGITFTGNSGLGFIGHKYGAADVSDLVFQWGDDAGTGPDSDRLRFLFTSNVNGAPAGMGSVEGLEAMRMWPKADKEVMVGIGDFYEGGDDPTERLDVRTGRLRIRQLPADDPTTSATKVMMVDPNGVVVWKDENDLPGGDSGCEWTMNPAAPNHVYTAAGAADPDCPDDAEAVGVGIDLSSGSPLGKLHVFNRDYDAAGYFDGMKAAANNYGLDVHAVGGTVLNYGVKVNTVGGSSSVGENTGIKVNVGPDDNGGYRRTRGVWAETDGAIFTAYAGRFESNDDAEYTWGVLGSTSDNDGCGICTAMGVNGICTANAGHSVGVNGQSGPPPPPGVGFYTPRGHTGVAGGLSLLQASGRGVAGSTGVWDMPDYGGRIGVQGTSYDAEIGNSSIGVLGYSGSAFSGISAGRYGVFGAVSGDHTNSEWAGWFEGDVMINGDGFLPGMISIMSDRKLKQNVKALSGASEVLEKLRPSYYEFRIGEHENLHLPSGRQIGLIAQEVQEVIPEIVKDLTVPARLDADGNISVPEKELKAVQYDALIPLLIAGHQEQQAVLGEKQARIDELQDRLDRLEELLLGEAGKGRMNPGSSTQELQSLSLFPNPFDDRTTIRYSVDCPCRVRLEVTTTDGKPIATVLDERREPGVYDHEWNTEHIAPGVYICTLVVDGKPTVKQAVKVSR